MKLRHCLIILIILNACQSWDESPATDDSVNMQKNDILFFEEENPDQARVSCARPIWVSFGPSAAPVDEIINFPRAYCVPERFPSISIFPY